MYRKFASLGYADKYAYAFNTDSFSGNNNAQIDEHFRMFETYGDDLCQHSGDWAITREFFTDYLASLAVVLMEDNELLEKASFDLSDRPSERDIKFAASVVWKEGKQRYFSKREEKISALPSKAHDKRYEEITTVHDGSAASIFRILAPSYSTGLMMFNYASAIRDWLLDADDRPYMGLPGEFLKWTDDRHQSLAMRSAYEACYLLVVSARARHAAESNLDNYKRSLEQATSTKD